MPWTERSVMDERIRFVIAAERGDVSMSELCRSFSISRPTGYRWLNRYRQGGCRIEAVREHSRRPRYSPNLTEAETVDRILVLRMVHGWGARKLQVLLTQEGFSVGESTINRVLKAHGLQYEPEVSGKATRRFSRKVPNDLWQMDFKGPYLIPGGRCCPLSIIDDHSRYLVGLYALANQQGTSVHRSLVETFQRYGVPKAMLIDHGTPWYSPNGHGLTWLSVALIKQGIRLCFSGLRHPQTQGKVERFHRTLGRSIRLRGYPKHLVDWQQAFDEIAEEYNQLRPHEALDMEVPASYYKSAHRLYQANPPAWEYPNGSIVRRLNTAGLLTWKGHKYFVSEALADEWVEVNQCVNTLLVRFRHTWIREIDIKTARSVTLIDNKHNPYV